ncbi:MAG: hypothetical protein HYZ13_03820 [Acidobacteria bacterium]|nr:hypothetical protein [Acidobacteriota bacterium]
MARPKREDEWVPVTVRMAASAALRLRVAAVKQGRNQGRILDDLVMAHLPPVQGAPTKKAPTAWTIERLQRELDACGANQSMLARELGISSRAVNNWVGNGSIPIGRQEEIQDAIRRLRKHPKS